MKLNSYCFCLIFFLFGMPACQQKKSDSQPPQGLLPADADSGEKQQPSSTLLAFLDRSEFTNRLALSLDGRLLACGGNKVEIFDLRTRKIVSRIPEQQRMIVFLAFLDTKELVVHRSQSETEIWNIETHQQLTTRKLRASGHHETALLPDKKTIAYSEFDAAVAFVNYELKPIGHPLKRYDPEVEALLVWIEQFAYSSRGVLATTAFNNHTLRLWYDQEGKKVEEVRLDGFGQCLAFSPKGDLLAVGISNTIKIWNMDKHVFLTNVLKHEGEGPLGEVKCLAFSPDGKFLVSVGWPKEIIAWETKTWQQRAQILRHNGPVRSVVFSPDGRSLITAGQDGFPEDRDRVYLWDFVKVIQDSER